MFAEKTRENVKFILVQQLCPGFVVLFFIFTRFNTTPLILLLKASPNSELQVSQSKRQ